MEVEEIIEAAEADLEEEKPIGKDSKESQQEEDKSSQKVIEEGEEATEGVDKVEDMEKESDQYGI